MCEFPSSAMLSSVWSKFVPSGRNRQTEEAQQASLGTHAGTPPTNFPAERRREDDSVSVSAAPASAPHGGHVCSCATEPCRIDPLCICTAQQQIFSSSVSRNGCAPNYCGSTWLRPRCSCIDFGCVCAHREPNCSDVELDSCGSHVGLARHACQQHRTQQRSLSEGPEGPPASQSRQDTADAIGRSTGHDCLQPLETSSCVFTSLADHQIAASQGGDAQRQPHWLAASLPLPVEEGSVVSFRSDAGYPEGWEHIRSDDTHTAHMCNDNTKQEAMASGNKRLHEALTPEDHETGTNNVSGSITGWSSPAAEFEFVADAAWCDVRRLLRLSNTHQPKGWDWACSGITSALVKARNNSSKGGEALTGLIGVGGKAGETAAVAGASESAGPQGCPVVKFLRSAMYSSTLSGSEFIRRHGTLGKPASGTGTNTASESSPAIVSGWGGRWQLTPTDSPGDSFSSCSGSDRKSGSAPVLPFAPSCKDGGSLSGPLGDNFQSQTQLKHVNTCGADAVRPRSPVGSPSLAANSGTQRGTLAANDGKTTVYLDSAHVASEVEASRSATVVSDPAESGRRRASARRRHGLLLHRAQRHLESQCRRKLKKNDMRLNILITALPGVDADVFCRQMFAEWQEVSRQHVSCGEEFVFRAPFVVPFVEVPVIAASSFASALPYCELRLLEGWERDKVLQQERTERRVHVCLFLIPHSALPLPAEVLALLKRLRAVACMLPLLVVQHTTSCEQILRDRGILRLQLAASDLATLEEMLLPLHPTPRGPNACAHCQGTVREKECHPSKLHSEQEAPLLGKGFCSSSIASTGKYPDGANPDTEEPETLIPGNSAESINNSLSGGSSKIGSQGQPTNGGYEGEGRRGDKFEEGSSPASRHRCKMQSPSGVPLCLSAVHLPLVLQLPLSGTIGDKDSRCTCRAGIDRVSEAVTTPLSLRSMLVEASAVLLRQRAEYGCFLPFLFQQQMLPNRTHKLRGLQQWEDEEKQQREQQQHVAALMDLRQGQIDSHPDTGTAMHMQRQLDGLREQLRKMQQELLHLQERRFLQDLLKEEAAEARPYPSPNGRVLPQARDKENGEREELLPQVAQTGLVLALMLGVGALLFNNMKRGNC